MILEYKKEEWNIGCYFSDDSVCINLKYDGKDYHRHDNGGILPRWVRMGWYIWRIEKESGCRKDAAEYVKQVRGL